jgi:hypothetical protein
MDVGKGLFLTFVFDVAYVVGIFYICALFFSLSTRKLQYIFMCIVEWFWLQCYIGVSEILYEQGKNIDLFLFLLRTTTFFLHFCYKQITICYILYFLIIACSKYWNFFYFISQSFYGFFRKMLQKDVAFLKVLHTLKNVTLNFFHSSVTVTVDQLCI